MPEANYRNVVKYHKVSLFACWAEARVKIARMTLTIKLDGNWSSFQLANSAPPLSVTGSAIAPSARILSQHEIARMAFAYTNVAASSYIDMTYGTPPHFCRGAWALNMPPVK